MAYTIVTISNVSKIPKAVIKPNLAIGMTSLNKNVRKLIEVVMDVKRIAFPILFIRSLKKRYLFSIYFFDLW